jgi:hypothetical protein
MAHGAAGTTATATVRPISTVAATTHTFDVHYYDESLSCSQPGHARESRGSNGIQAARFGLGLRKLGSGPEPREPYRGVLLVNRQTAGCTKQAAR